MVKKTINGREYLLREYNVADIDKLAIRMMEENQIAGLLAFRNIQNPEETYFRYDCRMGNTLEEWLLSVRTKNEVLHLLESILAVCDEVEAYLLDKGGLWTTIDGVIVENDTVYIYTPEKLLTYKIFAAYIYDDRHLMNSFDFADRKVYSDYLSEVKNIDSEDANIRKELPVRDTDKIITLITCIREQPEKRVYVQAVQEIYN